LRLSGARPRHFVRAGCEHTFVQGIRKRVQELLESGVRPAEIARRLGVAGSTVEYHLEQVERAETARQSEPEPTAPDARTQVATREQVAGLLEQDLGRAEIARRLGVSKATVSYHARRLGAPVDSRCARRYDWKAVQEYYDRGHSVRDCIAQFGFSGETWSKAVARGAVTPRPARMPAEEFFAARVHRARTYLKSRLLTDGFKEARCENCGIRDWHGQPLSLALHHINGDRDDNRVANLELLCPNCHSQTINFAGRNGHRRPKVSR
jgi:DNA-binding CsgD family transcriptional regulator